MYNLFLELSMILMFIVIPILIILTIVNAIKKKRIKKVLLVLVSVIVVLFTCFVGAMFTAPEDLVAGMESTTQSSALSENEEETTVIDSDYFTKEESITGAIAEIDTSLVKTLIDLGYSIEHATKIAEILNGIGIESISLYAMTGEAEKGLNAVVCYPNGLTDRDKRFTFTTEDGIVFHAGFLGEDLYDTEKGGYLKKYDEVHISEKTVDMETYIKLQMMAELEVKNYLNYPNSASFGLLDWGIGRSDDDYKIIGKVTAQNAFGVEDDISFAVWFKQTENGFVIQGVALDGQRVK